MSESDVTEQPTSNLVVPAIEVMFEQRSGRRWAARFDLGSETENISMALDVAWKHNAIIVGVLP